MSRKISWKRQCPRGIWGLLEGIIINMFVLFKSCKKYESKPWHGIRTVYHSSSACFPVHILQQTHPKSIISLVVDACKRLFATKRYYSTLWAPYCFWWQAAPEDALTRWSYNASNNNVYQGSSSASILIMMNIMTVSCQWRMENAWSYVNNDFIWWCSLIVTLKTSRP